MADLEQLVLTISADTRQMQRALAKLTGDVKSAGDNLDKAFKAPKVDDVAKSLNKTRFETANLAAQFQDIAVQLQGGSSPFTIALQQGTQISQVLGQRGAGGVVSLLGSAFTSLLSPVSLATIGIIAFGGAAIQYGAKAIGAVSDLDDKLKAHAELIKSLKDAYGEAGKGVDTAVKEAAAVLKTLLGFKTDDIKKEFQSLSVSISKSLSDFKITGLGPAIEENSRKFAAFNDVITTFKQTIKDGAPDVLAFRRGVQQIADTTADQKTRDLAKELLEMTAKAAGAQLAVEGTAKALRGFSAEALAAAEQGEAFAKALKSLGSTVSPNLSDREKIMKNYGAALDKAGSTEERLAAARARDDQLAVLSSNERKKAAEDAAKSAESAQKRFESAINSTTKRNAGLDGQIAGIGKGVGELTRLEAQYRLTEAAQQAFGNVSPAVAAQIDKVAASAGAAADKLARARLAFQIGQDSQTALLTPQDAAIAKQLSQTLGVSVPEALQSSYAETIRWNDALRGVASTMTSSMTSGLADILDGTKSAGEGFAALGKTIARSLEEAIIKMTIVAPLMRALQGGLGGLIPGLGAGLSIPKFAGGTSFAPGGMALVGERGPELINLPRGSQVIPNHALSNGGGNTSIVINNNTPSQVQAREVVDGRGNRSIQVTVDEMVASSLSRPGSSTRGALRNNFGASPVGVRR